MCWLSAVLSGICRLRRDLRRRKAEVELRGPLSCWIAAAFQVAVSDVSVTFTCEERRQLDQAQRTLFWKVTLDTCRLLFSLRRVVPKTELI